MYFILVKRGNDWVIGSDFISDLETIKRYYNKASEITECKICKTIEVDYKKFLQVVE